MFGSKNSLLRALQRITRVPYLPNRPDEPKKETNGIPKGNPEGNPVEEKGK